VARLLLIANAGARAFSRKRLEVIAKALGADYKVQVAETKRHGHATNVARGAVHEGFDVVVAMGGDGTLNEVANGLAGSRVPMGILPGGGTNVFARSLGIPEDLFEAASILLESGRSEPRRIPLGRADGRHFIFTCGMGFDGAIVRTVERRQRLKKAGGEMFYIWSGVLAMARYDRRTPHVRLSWGTDLEHHRAGLYLAICQSGSPFTYLREREFRVCPEAELDGGLDVFALDSMKVRTVLRTLLQTLTSGHHVRGRHALYVRDQSRLLMESDVPLPVQMDGEYVGERTRLELEIVPDALSVLA
jgi:YegS/Rv2252/BmrU family lipid kinase